MRKIDNNKIQAIQQAVIDLTIQKGASNLTTAGVAKQAGVSPATLYIYYKDKTDMLSRIYENVKDELHSGLDIDLNDRSTSLDDRLATMMRFSVEQNRKSPQKANFIQILWTSPELLDEHAQSYGTTADTILGDLIDEVVVSNDYVHLSKAALELLFANPSQLLTRDPEVSDSEIDTMIKILIKSVHI